MTRDAHGSVAFGARQLRAGRDAQVSSAPPVSGAVAPFPEAHHSFPTADASIAGDAASGLHLAKIAAGTAITTGSVACHGSHALSSWNET